MNDITIENIQKLEKIGLVIADSISDEYNSLKSKTDNNKMKINELYSEFEKVLGYINEEAVQNEK